MARPGKGRGLTLIELLVTLVVAGILIALAIPSFNQMFDKNRLKGAAERLTAEIQYARAQAISANEPVTITVVSGTDWCIGVTEGTAVCDCQEEDPLEPGACAIDGVLRVASLDEFRGTEILGENVSATIDPVRGIPDVDLTYTLVDDADSGPVVLESGRGTQVGVSLSPLGNVSLCSPAGSGNTWDYAECPE